MKENNNLSLSDLSSSAVLRKNESLLSLLLKDHTTGKNIKWGTDSYINHGYSFRDDQEIKIDLITGWYEGFIRPRVDKELDIQLARQRNRAEVFTPSWVIKLQVDAALEDMEELPLVDFIKTKWLEITCGEAPYMVNRYDMETGEVIPLKERSGFIDVKFKKLNQELKSEEEWLKLAIEIYKASYGYEYQGDSLLLARENLILTFIDNYFYMFGAFPKEKILLKITKIISLNVFQMNGLTYEVPYSDGGTAEFGTQLSLFEEVKTKEKITPDFAKIKFWNNNKLVDFKDLFERKDEKMKFDVVLGNPPYQIENKNRNRDDAIYPDFMNAAYDLGNKVILITPGRFLFKVGSTSQKWNNKMLNDKHLKVLYYENDSEKIFMNTDIKGGITITYRDSSKIIGPINIFTPYEEMRTILNKVWNDSNLYYSLFGDIMYVQNKFDLKALYKDYPELKMKLGGKGKERRLTSSIFTSASEVFKDQKDDIHDIAIYGRLNNERIYKYINQKYLEKHPNLNLWKVLVPAANGSGSFGETLSSPVVAQPKTGHTQTFISIGDFTTKFEAESCLKYLKTKFARAMLSLLKVTQNNKTKETWSKIPLQNFTKESDIDWTKSIPKITQQLYRKYNLSEEEISFIENNVKEME